MTKTHITTNGAAAICGGKLGNVSVTVSERYTLADSRAVGQYHTSLCQRCASRFTTRREASRIANEATVATDWRTGCRAAIPSYGSGCCLNLHHEGPCLPITAVTFYGSVAKAQARRAGKAA